MILTNEEAVKLIKNELNLKPEIKKLRDDSKELYALVEGDMFTDELIHKIEHIEGDKKSKARKKYARDIQDFFERLFQPIDNIAYATGGNKVYKIENEEVKKSFLKTIDNIKDSNTLQHWVINIGINLSHVDPNGLMFMEYRTIPKPEVYPTYKSINDIRCYERRGQLLEYLLFEPFKVEADKGAEYYRLVDDMSDRVFRVEGSDDIRMIEEMSFVHPFGEVPAMLNSNIVKVGTDYRVSPINPILGLSKEYARDQSIKTIYKFLQGFPIHWRYVTECDDCKGVGKTKEGSCNSCDGRGYLQKSDVTDMVTLPIPRQDEATIAPDIAGNITPDLETWTKYTEELTDFENIAFRTFWGTLLGTAETFGGRKTTTEVIFNKQPIENRLNKYADYAEFVEWKMSNWILKFLDQNPNTENKIVIKYGRNYVIEPSDTILARYEESKGKQENDVVLDDLFKQYLQATYRTNPVELAINILKSEIEPYLHQSLKDVVDVFGRKEAQRKVLFSKWWNTLKMMDYEKGKDLLEVEFNKWFEENKIEIEVEVQPSINQNQ